MKLWCWAAILTVAALILANGCAKGPVKSEVKGKVTFDGKPVESGTIRLLPVDGRTSMGAANIKQGFFRTHVLPKAYRIEISWPKLRPDTSVVGKYTTDLKEDYIIPELIPAKYNDKSELTWEVVPGVNERNFDLLSR